MVAWSTLFNPHDIFLLSQTDAAVVFLAPDAAANGLNEPGDAFAAALAAADFNGDGYEDLIVGAPGEEAVGAGQDSGAVFFFQGTGGGPSVERFKQLVQESGAGISQAGDGFGASLAAGDFNGDHLADLAAGAPGKQGGQGGAYVFSGDAWKLRPAGFYVPDGAAASDHAGSALAAGDFNGDGFDDLVIAAPDALVAGQRSGRVAIQTGSASGLQAGPRISQAEAGAINQGGDRFGAALAVGDFNRDGYDDLVVGAPGKNPGNLPQAGAVYVFWGGLVGLGHGQKLIDSTPRSEPMTGAAMGAALATGDFDGDGFDDLAAGAPSAAGAGELPSVVVYRGGRSGMAWTRQLYLEQAGGSSQTGSGFGSVLAAGDANGDGLADLAVGAPGEGAGMPQTAGVVAVFPGDGSGLTEGALVRPEQVGLRVEAGDAFGAALAFGRLFGTKADSLAVGAPGAAAGNVPNTGALAVMAGLPPHPLLTHGPQLGAVTDHSIRIWARADHAAELGVSYRKQGGPGWHSSPVVGLTPTTDFTGVVELAGLEPATRYDYRLLLDGSIVAESTASFKTLPLAAAPGHIRFALGSDLYFSDPGWDVFDRVAARQPDFLLMLGDQIAVDVPVPISDTRSAYERKHRVYWAEPSLAQFMQHFPTIMMWDDHEIWNDWSGGKSGRYLNARTAYDEYQGSHNPAPRIPGETYFNFRSGPIDFYVLDTRSYRSPRSSPDVPGRTMLGTQQKADLKDWLLTSTAPFKIIGSPSTFSDFGTAADTILTSTDSWHAFPAERAEISDFIREHCIPGVIFLSGDQHWTGVFRLNMASPYRLYEFLVTPLALAPRKRPPIADPQVLFQYDGSATYAIFDADSTVAPPRLSFDLFRFDDTPLYHLDLTPDDILPPGVCTPLNDSSQPTAAG